MARGHDEKRCRRALRSLFVAGQAPGQAGFLATHLAACPACRDLAGELSMTDRALGEACGARTSLSPFEAALVWHRLRAGLDLPEPARPLVAWREFAPWLSALAGLVLLLGLAWWLAAPGAAPDTGAGLASRGSMLPPSFQLVCLPKDDLRQARPLGGSASRCGREDTLGFTYLNPGGRYRGLALYAVDEDGAELWYLPHPAEPTPGLLPPADRPRGLTRTVRLGVNHRPGRYRVVGWFTEDILDLDAAQALGRGTEIDAPRRKDRLRVECPLEIVEAVP